jgi:hypothetical protein
MEAKGSGQIPNREQVNSQIRFEQCVLVTITLLEDMAAGETRSVNIRPTPR